MDGIEASDIQLTDEEVRRARRSYYANVSYFDSKVGELVQTIEEMGELDNTIFIITADHGDMLGEKGLWYKMSWFEHSARVPMIMAGPGIKAGHEVDNACSLVDLLPTMLDMASADGTSVPEFGMPVDGRSLLPAARGEADTDDLAIGEYCAEMTPHPVVMIRRKNMKYIHCDIDPAQLYDLDNDPAELTNLANDPAYADLPGICRGSCQSLGSHQAARRCCPHTETTPRNPCCHGGWGRRALGLQPTARRQQRIRSE